LTIKDKTRDKTEGDVLKKVERQQHLDKMRGGVESSSSTVSLKGAFEKARAPGWVHYDGDD